jgi:hypothetical protein
MRIEGSWVVGQDNVSRPFLAVRIRTASAPITRSFLVDSGSDRTILRRATLDDLGLPSLPTVPASVTGVGGQPGSVEVSVTLELIAVDGGVVKLPGSYPAFLDPDALDVDLLGRDVLDHFDVIISNPRQQVLLLRTNHTYQVVGP